MRFSAAGSQMEGESAAGEPVDHMSRNREQQRGVGAMNSKDIVELDLAGRKWLVSKTGNLEDLWNELTGEKPGDEDRIPYWTEVWPASKVLAGHISSCASLLRGRLCLDIGCGLGLTSMPAVLTGARVVAMDLEWPALVYTRRNARLNLVSPLSLVRMDWRNSALKPGVFDYIWAADILYETRFCEPLARLLRYSIKDNGRIWIADPERNISAKIWAYFHEYGFTVNEIKKEKAFIGEHGGMVRLMELTV